MKNYLIILATLFVSLFALTSCDDDDEGSGSGSTSAGMIGKDLRLSAVGGISFYYDKQGRLESIDTRSDDYEFSYNPGKITYDDGYADVTYTGKGYLASSKESYKDEESWGYEAGDVSYTFSYDGNGHLTKISMTEKVTIKEDGEKDTYTNTMTATITWKSDMIQKVVYDEKDDDGDRYIETWTFEYDKKNKEDYYNKYCQYAPSVIFWADAADSFYGMAYVGMMGKGPLYLPSACEIEEVEIENGDKDTYTRSKSFSYSFNSDGTLSQAYYDGSRYSYSYSDVDSSSDSRKAPFWNPLYPQKQKRHGLFGCHLRQMK